MTALWLLAQRVLATLTGRAGLAVTGAAAAADIGPFSGTNFDLTSFFGGGAPKRRRRRRALTASDKADIGFIAGVLGKPAGRDFAMIVAARR